jgi:hypothetical protein
MMFFLSLHGVLVAAISCILLWLADRGTAASFAAGGALSFLNLLLLAYAWPRLLQKKQVALSIGVIVFKFAILGWIIYEVVTRKLFQLGWFSAGLALVIASTVLSALQYSRTNSENPLEKVDEQ